MYTSKNTLFASELIGKRCVRCLRMLFWSLRLCVSLRSGILCFFFLFYFTKFYDMAKCSMAHVHMHHASCSERCAFTLFVVRGKRMMHSNFEQRTTSTRCTLNTIMYHWNHIYISRYAGQTCRMPGNRSKSTFRCVVVCACVSGCSAIESTTITRWVNCICNGNFVFLQFFRNIVSSHTSLSLLLI